MAAAHSPVQPLGFSCPSAAASANHAKMGWSKTTRIKVMLIIDIVFFCIELGAGFAVHSLALMADAFHMVRPRRVRVHRDSS